MPRPQHILGHPTLQPGLQIFKFGIPFREKDWYGIPFREKVWYGIPFRKKPF